MTKLGVCLSPFLTNSYAELVGLARAVEDYGFGTVFIPESSNDGLMCCQSIAHATSGLRLASWIVNIYLRQPLLCASAATMVQEESNGRFVLGLGVSHRPMLEAIGLEMHNPRLNLRQYIAALRNIMGGNQVGVLRVRAPSKPVPIHVAALALETVRLGAELADGLMLDNCSPDRLRRAIEVAHETLTKFRRKPADLEISAGLLVFIDVSRTRALDAARQSIARYAMLPAYNRLFARSGFIEEAKIIAEAAKRRDFGAAASAVNDRMVDALSIAGPPEWCRERLDQYRRMGADVIVLRPNPVAEDYVSCINSALPVFESIL